MRGTETTDHIGWISKNAFSSLRGNSAVLFKKLILYFVGLCAFSLSYWIFPEVEDPGTLEQVFAYLFFALYLGLFALIAITVHRVLLPSKWLSIKSSNSISDKYSKLSYIGACWVFGRDELQGHIWIPLNRQAK